MLTQLAEAETISRGHLEHKLNEEFSRGGCRASTRDGSSTEQQHRRRDQDEWLQNTVAQYTLILVVLTHFTAGFETPYNQQRRFTAEDGGGLKSGIQL